MSNGNNSGQTIVIATFLSLIVAKGKTDEELNFIGNLLVGVGTNLLVIAAANTLNTSQSQIQSDKKT